MSGLKKGKVAKVLKNPNLKNSEKKSQFSFKENGVEEEECNIIEDDSEFDSLSKKLSNFGGIGFANKKGNVREFPDFQKKNSFNNNVIFLF